MNLNFKILFSTVILLIISASIFSYFSKKNELEKEPKSISEEIVITDNSIKKLDVETQIPNFSSFTDVKLKKKTFFEFIYPMVVNTNIDILNERKLVLESNKLNSEIEALCSKYRIKCLEEDYKLEFLKKVNIIPASLALAQAANESAWGTSRFAKQANNYFGQWCFTKGCGLIPKKRSKGMEHEVRKFKHVNDSVRSYITNLNNHPAYNFLREIRENQSTYEGVKLAEGLIKYSERGEDYIEEIQSMINYNKLYLYDKKMLSYLNI